MKANQLFKTDVENELLDDILNCFSLKSLQDIHTFTKHDLKKNNAVAIFNETILERLEQCYIHCKAKIYLSNINEKRLITILRQILKTREYSLASIKKTRNKEKVIFYKIISCKIDTPKFNIIPKQVTVF